MELLLKNKFIILQLKKLMNCPKCNSSINVKLGKIKEGQRTNISIPLGMQQMHRKSGRIPTECGQHMCFS
jgi:hypothetical protein